MMRTHLSGHFDADLLSLADQPHRLLRAYMAHMVVNPCRFGEQNIASDMNGFRLIRNTFQSVLSRERAFIDRTSFHQ
ncbi:hypothetical protein D3C87_1913230 [compost metagenome]